MTTIFECDMCTNTVNLKTAGIFTDHMNKIQKLGWSVFKGGAHTCPKCNTVETELQKQIEKHRNSIKQMQSDFEEFATQQEIHEEPIKIQSKPLINKRPSIEMLPDTDKRLVYECRYCKNPKKYYERSKKGGDRLYRHERKEHPTVWVALSRGSVMGQNQKASRRAEVWISWSEEVNLDKVKNN